MKKVFFTVIAIIAFSSLSLANTISDENEVVICTSSIIKNNDQKISNIKTFKGMTLCEIVGTIASHDVFMATGDIGAANRAGIAAMVGCLLG